MSSGSFRVSANRFKLDFTNAGFVRGKKESMHFHFVEEHFKGQTKTLEKLRKQEDRICEISKYDGNPVGMIVYKKENQTKKSLEIENSLAIKSLIVFDGQTKEEGFRTCLLKRLAKVAEINKVSSIHIKVDSNDQSLNRFLAQHGFKIIENSKTEKNNKQVLRRGISNPTNDSSASKRKRTAVGEGRNGLKKPRETKEI